MSINMSRRERVLTMALVAAVAAAGCSPENTPSEPTLVVPVFSQGVSDHAAYGTHMTGAEETPPKPSKAQGQLILTPREDGSGLAYKLVISRTPRRRTSTSPCLA
jgi:hypothetical protein